MQKNLLKVNETLNWVKGNKTKPKIIYSNGTDDYIKIISENQLLEPVSHFEYLGRAFPNYNEKSAVPQRYVEAGVVLSENRDIPSPPLILSSKDMAQKCTLRQGHLFPA